MSLKKGFCTNKDCIKYNQIITTNDTNFECPVCKTPLSPENTEPEISRPENQPTNDNFPWKGAITVLILSIAAFIFVYFYNEYRDKKRQEEADAQKNEYFSTERQKPTILELQKDLNQLIKAEEHTKFKELKKLKAKYLNNMMIWHHDYVLSQKTEKNTYEDYLNYLNIFSQAGISIRVAEITVDTIEFNRDTFYVYISEKMIENYQ